MTSLQERIYIDGYLLFSKKNFTINSQIYQTFNGENFVLIPFLSDIWWRFYFTWWFAGFQCQMKLFNCILISWRFSPVRYTTSRSFPSWSYRSPWSSSKPVFTVPVFSLVIQQWTVPQGGWASTWDSSQKRLSPRVHRPVHYIFPQQTVQTQEACDCNCWTKNSNSHASVSR